MRKAIWRAIIAKIVATEPVVDYALKKNSIIHRLNVTLTTTMLNFSIPSNLSQGFCLFTFVRKSVCIGLFSKHHLIPGLRFSATFFFGVTL